MKAPRPPLLLLLLLQLRLMDARDSAAGAAAEKENKLQVLIPSLSLLRRLSRELLSLSLLTLADVVVGVMAWREKCI